jgi:hypothetical protein
MSDGVTDMMRDYEDDPLYDLKKENEDLKTKLIDLTFEMNYNKQTELIEFVREIYDNVCSEMKTTHSKLTKKELLFSLKKNIEEFARNNNINISN